MDYLSDVTYLEHSPVTSESEEDWVMAFFLSVSPKKEHWQTLEVWKTEFFSGGSAQIWHRKKWPHRAQQSLTSESGFCRFKHHTPSLYETSSIWYLVVFTYVPSLGCFENQNKLGVCVHVHKKDLVAAWWVIDSQKFSFWPPFTERVDLSRDKDFRQSIDMLICK